MYFFVTIWLIENYPHDHIVKWGLDNIKVVTNRNNLIKIPNLRQNAITFKSLMSSGISKTKLDCWFC